MPISVPGNTTLRSPSAPFSFSPSSPLDKCVHVCVNEGEAVLSMPAVNEMDQSMMALLLLMFKPTRTSQRKFLVKDSMDAVKSYLLYC